MIAVDVIPQIGVYFDDPLPDGIYWLRYADESIFPCYGPSGGLASYFICYLVKGQLSYPFNLGTEEGFHEGFGAKWWTIRIYPASSSVEEFRGKMLTAIKELLGNTPTTY